MTAKTIATQTQRDFEVCIGGAFLSTFKRAVQSSAMRRSKLVAKKALLPKCYYVMYYHEREAQPVDGKFVALEDQPTLLFFHGISQKSDDLAHFIASLDIPPHVRILVPEQSGHGRDIERAKLDRQNYVQPNHLSMLESTSEFLDAVRCGPNTCAFGISLGGAVCYYVAHQRPDIIKKSVLVSPAVAPCVDKDLVRGLRDGTNNFICFESRDDVRMLFRDLSTGRDDLNRKKINPVPTFFCEYIYRSSLGKAPEGHYRRMILSLLSNAGLDENGGVLDIEEKGNNPFTATTDIDKDAKRLVIWPKKDQIVNFEQGKDFFGVTKGQGESYTSSSTDTEFESIPDCGHIFTSDGRIIMDLIRVRVRDYLLGGFDEEL